MFDYSKIHPTASLIRHAVTIIRSKQSRCFAEIRTCNCLCNYCPHSLGALSPAMLMLYKGMMELSLQFTPLGCKTGDLGD